MNLDDELSSAWAGVDPPSGSSITNHRCDECDEVRDFFAGEPWTSFTDVAALRNHYDALSFFAPAAFHYYLPAFIRAALIDPQSLIADGIVSTIRLEFGVASAGRLELFSSAQRRVVAQFFRALRDRDLLEAHEVETMAELLAG